MKKILYLIGIIASVIFVSCLIGLVFALPNPHSLSGRVYDNIGNPISDVEIVLTNQRTEGQLYVKTNQWGEYQQDAYNLPEGYKNGDTIHYYARFKGYKLEEAATIDIAKGGTKLNFVFPFCLGFITPKGTYPSIAGTHKGIIIPSATINVSHIETRACEGTGGHAKYVKITGDISSEAVWNGYNDEYHTLEFDVPFTLEKGKTYTYEIKTGSYPQIIHLSELEVPAGVITCTEFVDTNGKVYKEGIPSILLGEEI